MKKFLRILGIMVLSVILTTSLFACGTTSSEPTSESTPGTEVTTDTGSESTGPSYEADPIEETDLTISVRGLSKTTVAYIYTAFKAEGFVVSAKVKDANVYKTAADLAEVDGLTVYLGTVSNSADYVVGKTMKILVAANGATVVEVADSVNSFAASDVAGLVATASDWSETGKAIDGYKVELTIPYEALGLTAETAKGAISFIPELNDKFNKTLKPALGTPAEYKCDVTKQKTFIIVTNDNTYELNEFGQNGTFGSVGAFKTNEAWDLSKDYYQEDPEYVNRKAVLETPAKGTDNNLYFYKNNDSTIFVESTFQATGIFNGEMWGKFGIAIEYNGTGLFFYVDASCPAGSTLPSQITGSNVGLVPISNGNYNWASDTTRYVGYVGAGTIKLSVFRQGTLMRFFANDNLIFEQSAPELTTDVLLYPQIRSFNIGLELTNFKSTVDPEDPDIEDNLIEQKEVDWLFIGDSYVDTAFWSGFKADMEELGNIENIGIGGTKIPFWKDYIGDMAKLYKTSNIVIHIGVNDIDDAGYTGEAAANTLQNYFTLLNAANPEAHIYWIAINANYMFPNKVADYLYANQKVAEFAATVDYLTVIDFFADEELAQVPANYFSDGLHLSKVGYAYWTKQILEAAGKTVAEGTTLGSNEAFTVSGGWDVTNDNGDNAYVVNNGASEQQIWFKNAAVADFYFEAQLNTTLALNGDEWSKFGLTVKNATSEIMLYVDATAYSTGVYKNNNVVGFVERTTSPVTGKLSNWTWNEDTNRSKAVDNLLYTGTDYVTLGILKSGANFFFYVNGQTVLTCNWFSNMEGEAYVGITAFNNQLTAKNYTLETSAAVIEEMVAGRTIISDKIETEGDVAVFEESSSWTIDGNTAVSTGTGENILTIKDVKGVNLYVEIEMNVAGLNGADDYPKAGLLISGTQYETFFYVDALAKNGSFTGNNYYAYVQRTVGGNDWTWNQFGNGTNLNPVRPGTGDYLGGKVKMAVLKYNGVFYFILNNKVLMANDSLRGNEEEVTASVLNFNIKMNVYSAIATTADSELQANMETLGLKAGDIVIDGDIADWTTANKTLGSYKTTATDGSGKFVEYYAFKNTKGIYIAGKAATANDLRVNVGDDWWNNTNLEYKMSSGMVFRPTARFAWNNPAESCSCAYEFDSVYNEATGLYEITFEVFMTYAGAGYSSMDDTVSFAIAFRNEDTAAGMCEGGTNNWWTGNYHAHNTVNYPFVVTENGILWNEGAVITGSNGLAQ